MATAKQEARWKAELEIIQDLGRVPSSREMQKLLLEKYGIKINHNIVNQDLKKDLESLTESEYENQKQGILNMLDTEISIAHNIATTDDDNSTKLKAMNTVSKLSRVKADILNKFRQLNATLNKTQKAQYTVFIGEPKMIDSDKYKKLKGDIELDENSE